MSSETSDKLGFPKLGENNYSSWSVDMQAKLMDKRYWRGHIDHFMALNNEAFTWSDAE